MKKQEILDSLRKFSATFPETALKEIQANREEYIPGLLEALDYAYTNAKELCDNDSDYFLHIYAMYLLAEFREKKAFPLLVAFLRLSEDHLGYLLGDHLAGGFHRLLLSTFDGINMHMLFDIIENKELYEWARIEAIQAYELLYQEGFVVQEEYVSQLRSFIYDKLSLDDADLVSTSLIGCVIDSRLIQMIPDIRFLYDNQRVELTMYGGYDDFIDWLFGDQRKKKHYIDDALSEMEWWSCFIQKPRPRQTKKKTISRTPKSQRRTPQGIERSKGIGRNDPCPCGSGKKYKKCCYDLYQNTLSSFRSEDRDLLKNYPMDSPLFAELYEEEAIGIDKLVYLALHRRTRSMWGGRDYEQERLDQINYLKAALDLFIEKCQREQIASFAGYDERHMVHYRSSEWVAALLDLIHSSDSCEIMDIKKIAKETIEKFS